jgi:hypothetical protein
LTLSALTALAALPTPSLTAGVAGAQLLYAVSGDKLYEISVTLDKQGNPTPGGLVCSQVALAGITSVISLAPNGAGLDALVNTSTGYVVVSLAPGGINLDGLPGVNVQALFAPPATEAPGAILGNGSTVYLAFSGGTTTPTGIWQFDIPAKGAIGAPKVIPTPQAVTSMRLAGGSLFLSLADGGLGQLDTAGTFQPVSVLAPDPVSTSDPSAYTAATPVPAAGAASLTPSATAQIGAAFGAGSTLVSDPLNATQLLLADVSVHRIVRLTANTSGPGAGLSGQYVYDGETPTFSMLALGGTGATLQVYAWNGAQLLAFPIPEPTS